MKLKRIQTTYISATEIADIIAEETPEGIAKVFNAIAEKLENQTTTSEFRFSLISKCLNPFSRWMFKTVAKNLEQEEEK